MQVPPADDPAWAEVLTGKVRHELDFFAAKILLGWLLLKVESDPSAEVLAEAAGTLQHLFAQNSRLPCVQRDLARIFGWQPPVDTPPHPASPNPAKEA